MANVTIRLDDEQIKILSDLYGAKVTGSQKAIEGFIEMQRRTMQELKGLFLESELNLILDNLNGTLPQAQFMGAANMFWWHLEDGESFDNLFEKWGVDFEQMKAKVLALTSAQCYCLQDAAFRWWNNEPTAVKELSTFNKLING